MAIYLTKSLLNKITNCKESSSSCEVSEKFNNSHKYEMKHKDDCFAEMVCRVCSGSGCTHLLTKLNSDYDIMSALKSVTNISMNIDDSLPKYICKECLDMLKTALTLKKTCETSDRNFKRKLNLMDDPFLHSYPYSKHDFHSILHKMKLKRQKIEDEKERRRQKMKKLEKIKEEPKIKEIKCSSCDVAFDDKGKLSEHRRERQCMRRACELCGQLVISISQHMRHVHKDENPHKCDICGKQFAIVARLKSHMLVHTNTFKFHCDLCPYKSKHKYYLVMHMRTHTGEKPYKCPLCPSTFVNPSNLNKHKLIHQDKQFPCTMCQKSFRTMPALREHTRAAHMNIKHTCTCCGRVFCYKSDLRKHEIQSHNREKRCIGGEPSYKQVERLQKMKQESWNTDEQTTLTHNNEQGLAVDSVELSSALPTSQYGDTSQVVTSQLITALPPQEAPMLHASYKVESGPEVHHSVSDYMIYFTDDAGMLHPHPTTITIQQHPTEIMMGDMSVKKDEVKIYPGPHQGITFFQ